MIVKISDLIEILMKNSTDLVGMLDKCSENIDFTLNCDQKALLIEKMKNLQKTFIRNWKGASHNKKTFLNRHKKWLAGEINVSLLITDVVSTSGSSSSLKKRGAPQKAFDDLAPSSKRRRIADLRKEYGDSINLYMGTSKAIASDEGNHDLKNVLDHVIKHQDTSNAVLKQLKHKLPRKLDDDQAAAELINLNLSVAKYEAFAALTKRQDAPLFPSYKRARLALEKCAPPGVSSTAEGACVSWQNLLQHTAERLALLPSVADNFNVQVTEKKCREFVLIGNYGFDGSGQQKRYQQELDKNIDDSSIFVTSFIPLRIVTKDFKEVIWTNESPHSPRMCRIKKTQFVKETREMVMKEKEANEKEIDELENLVVTLESGEKIFIETKLCCNLIDGKVRAFLTGASSFSVCPICKCNSLNMNNLEACSKNGKFQVQPQALQYGLSVLHIHIRVLEALLHLSYKSVLPDGQYRVTEKFKAQVEANKKEVKSRFRDIFGYNIDTPTANGGTTTTGKIARTALSRPKDLAKALNVDEALVHRLHIILVAISSCLPIDVEKFDSYAKETAELYVKLYNKFPMTPSLHVILMHGAELIQNAIMPIGILSEEAAEANNKHIRNDRLEHARKDSREHNNLDVFVRSLFKSDPILAFIALQQRNKRKKHQELPDDAKALILFPRNSEQNNVDDSEMQVEENDEDQSYIEALDERQFDCDYEMEYEYEMENSAQRLTI